MKRLMIYIVAVISMVCSGQLLAREFRTPLPWTNGTAHFPLDPSNEKSNWLFEGWAGAYSRTADRAYKNGTNTTTLGKLLFGAECFRLSDSFACRGKNSVCENPFVKVSCISPEFNYDERGVIVGGRIERQINSHVRLGVRTVLPFRRIASHRIASEDVCHFKDGSESLSDVVKFNRERISGNTYKERWAFRLDFLSALTDSDWPIGDKEFMVKYDVPLTIATANAGAPSQDNMAVSNAPGVHLKRSVTGDEPSLPCAAAGADVVGASALSADGATPAVDGARARFDSATDYAAGGLAADIATQSTLWLVPTTDNNTSQNASEANSIQEAVEDRLKHLEFSGNTDICKFLIDNCLCFEDQSTAGVGDWDWDLYVGYDITDWLFVNGILGFRFPLASEVCNPGRLFALPRGNNGHYEVKVGLESGWSLLSWFALRVDASYNFVLKDAERVGASFCGACVKNIGPCTCACVGWGYFNGRVAATVFYPKDLDAGFTVGYELHAKAKDSLSFSKHSINDFCDSCEQLDNCVAERDTDRIAHTVRGEFFYRHNYWYVSAGASHVFAGKNVPRESDIFARIKLEF